MAGQQYEARHAADGAAAAHADELHGAQAAEFVAEGAPNAVVGSLAFVDF